MDFGEILRSLQKKILLCGGGTLLLILFAIVMINILEESANSWRERKLEKTLPKEEEDDY